MKILILFSTLLFVLSAHAQDTRLVSYSKTFSFNSDESVIYSHSLNFSQKRDVFFDCNSRVKNKKWALGRVQWAFASPTAIGYDFSNDQTKDITAQCKWLYQVPGTDGCIQSLAVSGMAHIHCDGKSATITIDNLNYINCNTLSPPAVIPFKANKPCPERGSLLELVNCAPCPKTVDAVTGFLEKSIQDLFNSYNSYVNSPS